MKGQVIPAYMAAMKLRAGGHIKKITMDGQDSSTTPAHPLAPTILYRDGITMNRKPAITKGKITPRSESTILFLNVLSTLGEKCGSTAVAKNRRRPMEAPGVPIEII